MKKKLIISVFVVAICAVLIAAVGKLQKGSDNTDITGSSKTKISESDKAASTAGANSSPSKVSDSNKKSVQNSTSSASKQSSTKNTENSKNNNVSVSSNQTSNSKIQTQKPAPSLKPNFIVVNTITGKTILSIHVNFSGESAANATMKALDANGISYRASGMGSSIYFSAIDGLKERDAGAASGWCYYINGSKLGVSVGKASVGPNDKIEWKFLKDGTTD